MSEQGEIVQGQGPANGTGGNTHVAENVVNNVADNALNQVVQDAIHVAVNQVVEQVANNAMEHQANVTVAREVPREVVEIQDDREEVEMVNAMARVQLVEPVVTNVPARMLERVNVAPLLEVVTRNEVVPAPVNVVGPVNAPMPIPAQHSKTAVPVQVVEPRLNVVNRPREDMPTAHTMAQLIQQTTPMVMTMVTQMLDHHLKQRADSVSTDATNPKLTKMTKPATLSLEFQDGTETLKEKASQFKIGCMDYFSFYQLNRATWTTHAYHWLSGRLKRTYTKMYENTGRHMSWDELCSLIDGLAAGTEQTQYEVREKITKFSLEHECMKGRLPHMGHRHITYGIGMLEELLAHITPMDEKSKCFYLWHALPTCMKTVLRHDPQNVQQEYVDYMRLKQACINHSLTFDGYMVDYITKNDPRKRDRERSPSPPPVPRRSRGYVGMNAVDVQTETKGRSSFRSIDPMKEEEKPNISDSQKLMTWEPKARLWRKGLSQFVRDECMKKGMCVICGKPGHIMKHCMNAKEMYQQGDMFYYHPQRKYGGH